MEPTAPRRRYRRALRVKLRAWTPRNVRGLGAALLRSRRQPWTCERGLEHFALVKYDLLRRLQAEVNLEVALGFVRCS